MNETDDKKENALSLNIDDFSEQEMDDMCAFVSREDLATFDDMEILYRDEKFVEAEIIVLFRDELFIRSRKGDKITVHNERLGMDSSLKMEWDEAISIQKKHIVSIE